MSEKYNGWTNWETWNYMLWSDNNGLSDWYREYAVDNKSTVEDVAEMLENEVWQNYEEQIITGFFGDVVSNAICEINFHEIAESILEGVVV
jgi:hypothetical protein